MFSNDRAFRTVWVGLATGSDRAKFLAVTTRRSRLSDLDKGSSELGNEAAASGNVRIFLVSLYELPGDYTRLMRG